jgi:hypothetical protein
LRKNGGGSLTDKSDRIYAAMFPADGPSLPQSVAAIAASMQSMDERQSIRVALVDQRHFESTERMDKLEVLESDHADIRERMDHAEGRFDRLEQMMPAKAPEEAP